MSLGRWSIFLSVTLLFLAIGVVEVCAEPRINVGGVKNSASLASDQPVAPGSIASLFGSGLAESVSFVGSAPFPTELGGTQVFVNNIPAPLFYVSPEQINFQIPWEVGGAADLRVKVSSGWVFSNVILLELAPAAPGIFSVSQNGKGQGSVISEAHDWKLVGPPLTANFEAANHGDLISIFATGLGAVSNAPATGQASAGGLSHTVLPISVSVGGVSAEVTFAGLAPGFVGLYQVNARVPEGAPQGAEVPLTVSVDGAESNTVTIAIGEFPLITAIEPPAIFLDRESFIGGIAVYGSGFGPEGALRITSPFYAETVLGQATEDDYLTFGLSFGYTWNPGWFDVSVSGAPESGGGFSNKFKFAFLGNQNTLVVSETEAFQLDQLDQNLLSSNGWYGVTDAHMFDLASGEETGSFLFSPYESLVDGIAVDDVTGRVVYTRWNYVVAINPDDGQNVAVGEPVEVPLAVSARGGYACVSQDLAGTVASMDLSIPWSELVPTPIGDTPWNVSMADLPDNGLVCVVFSVGDTTLSIIKIPEMTLVRSVVLSELTPRSRAEGIGTFGGWQMDVFHSGPSRGIAAVLHQFDNILVFIDLETGREVSRVELSGIPFRVAADDVSGNLVVAFADPVAGLTRFVEVSPRDGVVTPLSVVTDLLAVGLKISADGRYIYAAMRNQFRILPKH